MPVDHQRRLIFVHIPKTGGTAIEKALGICGENNDGDPFIPCFELLYGNNLQHLTLAEIFACAPAEWRLQRYHIFYNVRNPWDRILSEYHWRRLSDQSLAATTFEHFIEALPRRMQTDSRHFWPQAKFVPAWPNLRELRFENLERDFAAFLAEKGLGTVTLERWNATRADGRYQEHFSGKMKEVVERCYVEDVVRFNYKF